MSVTPLSETREFGRRLEYSRETVLPGIFDNAIDSQPTISLYAGRIANALFPELGPMGAGKRTMGGESIVKKVRLGVNETMKSLAGGYDTFDTTPQSNVVHARYNWKLYGGTVNISGHEIDSNQTSMDAVANIIDAEMRDAVNSLVDLLGGHIYDSAGVPTRLTDLPTLISANDTVGGLPGGTYQEWNSRGVSADGTAAASIVFEPATTSFAAAGLANMRVAWNNASEGATTMPDAITTTFALHEAYEGSLEPQHRITNMALADGGIRALEFKGAAVLPDRKCTTGLMVFHNFDALYLTVMSGADFASGPFQEPDAQRVRIAKIWTTLELTVADRKRVNKLTGLTA